MQQLCRFQQSALSLSGELQVTIIPGRGLRWRNMPSGQSIRDAAGVLEVVRLLEGVAKTAKASIIRSLEVGDVSPRFHDSLPRSRTPSPDDAAPLAPVGPKRVLSAPFSCSSSLFSSSLEWSPSSSNSSSCTCMGVSCAAPSCRIHLDFAPYRPTSYIHGYPHLFI